MGAATSVSEIAVQHENTALPALRTVQPGKAHNSTTIRVAATNSPLFPRTMTAAEQEAAAKIVLVRHIQEVMALENALHAEEARTNQMLAHKLYARRQRLQEQRERAKKGYI